MLIQAPLMICKNLPNQKCVKKPILLRHHFLQYHYVFGVTMDSDYSLNEQEKGNVFIFTAYQYIFSPLSLTGIVNELWTNNPDDAESG